MSVDSVAAREMVRRSGQMGVPVIVAGNDVIVGFDRARLERIAAGYAGPTRSGADRPTLGLRVRDVPSSGVEVGGVRTGTLGERAGVRVGDVLESLNGQPVQTVADLERMMGTMRTGQRLEIVVRRDGRLVRLDALT